jgi:hypothetical protein
MRLIKAKVSGYKRLAEDCELNLDTDPVCIVGPNAAGKSSFLDALVHLNDDKAFVDGERTRIPGGGRREPDIEARFELEEDDRERLKDIPEASDVSQFLVLKDEEDGLYYLPDPLPKRDLSKREAVRERLEMLRAVGWPSQVQEIEQVLEAPPNPLIGRLFDEALELAEREKERIEDEAPAFRSLAIRINQILAQRAERQKAAKEKNDYDGPDWPAFPANLQGFPAELVALTASEVDDHPMDMVEAQLKERVPRFLKFDDPARDLQTRYDLNDEVPEADRGIHNFLALAGTTWMRARRVSKQDDPGVTKTYREELDERLEEKAALKWGQDDITIAVELNPPILSVVIRMQERDFIGFTDHSDGLKAFVALRAFVSRAAAEGNEVKPIVLIDEADRHLHYDAQADLISVFEEQDEAAQIIYTTHSAGCLPRDLGLGIRAIVPKPREVDGELRPGDHSEAINRFWTKGPGFSPLLLAMGAGAFAFAATQFAVVTEGMSDALLLPTLLREATGRDRLRYQAVPGFAEATPDEVNRFDLIAGRVAFLADGDDGGRKHVKKLLDNGIEEEQIIFLGDDPESGLSIEDLLPKDVYLNAVNGQLKTWHGIEFPAKILPAKGRSKTVEDWCEEQIGRNDKPIELSKVDVAQRVLDQRGPKTKLLAKAPTAKKLDKNINAVFDGAKERMKRLRERAAEVEAVTEQMEA